MTEKMSTLDRLRARVDEWCTMDTDTIVRPDFRDLAFVPIKSDLDGVVAVSQLLQTVGIDKLPEPLALMALTEYDKLSAAAVDTRDMDPMQLARAGQQIQDVVRKKGGRLKDAATQYWNAVPAIAAFAIASDLRRTAAPLSDKVRAMLDRLQVAAGDAEQQVASLRRLADAEREEARKFAVEKHAGTFAKQATGYGSAATKWLICTIALAAATGAFVGLNILWVVGDPRVQSVDVSLLAAKVLAFTSLVTATLWCGRLFRASKHNEALNRQRQAALDSFRTFVETTADEQTKNAVLLHAAQAIFAHQPTGFVSEGTDSTPHLLEMVRVLGPQKSASGN